MNCKNCKFFEEIHKWGYCRRNSPSPMLTSQDVAWPDTWTWPKVKAEDWCGEFVLTDTRVAIGQKKPPSPLDRDLSLDIQLQSLKDRFLQEKDGYDTVLKISRYQSDLEQIREAVYHWNQQIE